MLISLVMFGRYLQLETGKFTVDMEGGISRKPPDDEEEVISEPVIKLGFAMEGEDGTGDP